MSTYHVTWEIDLDAETPRAAAETAQRWMNDADTRWCFTVTDCTTLAQHQVDLEQPDTEPATLRSHNNAPHQQGGRRP